MWLRRESKFYMCLRKRNRDGSMTAFYDPQFPHDATTFEHFDSTRSFIRTVPSRQVNKYIVEDTKPSKYSQVKVGSQVFVETSVNTAVLGTVITIDTTGTGDQSQYKFVVRLSSDSSYLEFDKRNVWLLPKKSVIHGKDFFCLYILDCFIGSV